MSEERPAVRDRALAEPERSLNAAVEVAVRLGVLLLLVASCLLILAPFASLVIWAVILSIASEDFFERLAGLLRNRRGVAAAILVCAALAALIVPAVLLSESLVSGAQRYAGSLSAGEVRVPPPPAKVADWPLVGEQVFDAWRLASENLEAALGRLRPQLEAVSGWLLAAAGSAGVALLQLAGSLVLAGVMLARGKDRDAAITRFFTRLSPERGAEFARLSQATVKSVVQGIVGVAALQAILAGVGFGIAGVPAAGLWALLVMVAAVVQLPVLIVMVPPVLLVFSQSSGIAVAAFAIWCLVVSLLDNVLKPMLFGRGVDVPTIVIFLGAIGGMLSMGIIGLFLGAVVLTLGYRLFTAWLAEADASPPEPS